MYHMENHLGHRDLHALNDEEDAKAAGEERPREAGAARPLELYHVRVSAKGRSLTLVPEPPRVGYTVKATSPDDALNKVEAYREGAIWADEAADRGEVVIRRGQKAPAPVDFADIVAQESVKRALEVAAVGGHTVVMGGAPGQPLDREVAAQFVAAFPTIGGDPGRLTTAPTDSDMAVQVVAPHEADVAFPPPAEPSAVIRKRVETAIATSVGAERLPFDHAAEALLRDAARHLMDMDTDAARRVARSVAALDGSETIRRLHVAEALSYQRVAVAEFRPGA